MIVKVWSLIFYKQFFSLLTLRPRNIHLCVKFVYNYVTSPVFHLTGLLQHGNSLIIKKIPNSLDYLAHFLQEKPIIYVIKSDMSFKDFTLYKNLSTFFETPCIKHWQFFCTISPDLESNFRCN